MTRLRLPRLAAALLVAGLGSACKKHSTAPPCVLPPPQPSALPTYTPATVPAVPTQTEAIAFGVKTTGETVSFTVPPGTASVTIVEQGASSTIPLAVFGGSSFVPNTPVPLAIDASGGQIYWDVPMPPAAAFHPLPPSNLTVLEPLWDTSLGVYFFSAGAWTGALTVPSMSRADPVTGIGTVAPPPPGAWTVTVSDWAYECRNFSILGCTSPSLASSPYDVTVILKPVSPATTVLPIAFYLVTNSGLTAAKAPTNIHVLRMKQALTQILAPAGITPSFAFVDVPLDVRLQYATGVDASSGGACGTMDQLLAWAGPGNRLNVFLVDLIRDSLTGGFNTVGLDPIVPGPASFGGTPASGVVVSMENLDKVVAGTVACTLPTLSIGTCGADLTASVVAHEAGHFLGLQHTTEGIGTIVDPIADSATCFCPLCAPTADVGLCQGLAPTDPQVKSPYRMLVTDCLAPSGSTPECGAGDNLMFWLLDTDSKGLLTANQAAVMLASPLVQ